MNLDDDNFDFFAIKSYINHQCLGVNEYKEDIKLIFYINKYVSNMDTYSLRLIVNKFICYYNVFKKYEATRMLFYKSKSDNLSRIKTILWYLNLLPDEIPELDLDSVKIDKDLQIRLSREL